MHCIKSVRIPSYSDPQFPPFGLNTEKYGVSLRLQSESVKIRTRTTPNTDSFYAVMINIFAFVSISATILSLIEKGRTNGISLPS